MNITIDWIYLVAAALATVGVMEWAKGFPGCAKAPSWVWRLMLAVVSIGIAFIADGGFPQIGTNAAILLALSEVGYPLLVKLPASLIERKV